MPFHKMSELQRGVHYLVVFYWDVSYGLVDVFLPIRQGQLPHDWPDGRGFSGITSVGPPMCCYVIDLRVDVSQGSHPRGKDQELHE